MTLLVQVKDSKMQLNGGVHPDQGTMCFNLAPDYGTVADPGNLVKCLNAIFELRTSQFAFKHGMENRTDLPLYQRIEKTVYLRPGTTLNADAQENLIQQIKGTGADPVIVLSEEDYNKKFGSLFEGIPLKPASPPTTTTTGPPSPSRPIEGGVLNGRALNLPQPDYPEAAKKAHQSGSVVVRVLIDETGKVVSAVPESGLKVFREPAREAALKASFSPTKLAGHPVKVTGVVIYRFVGD